MRRLLSRSEDTFGSYSAKESTGRFAVFGLIALALLTTLYVNLRTLANVSRARTSVPWQDQWAIVKELEQLTRGASLWPVLWSPYWGHRLVVPRLLFLADAHWFSFAPLTWLTLLFQFVHIAFLMALAWLLLRRRSLALFMIAVVTIMNLMLSPFQMENFVWGMQTMFALVFMAATGAFFCLSLSSAGNRKFLVLLCLILGLVSSYTMPNGILVWPVLVAQGFYLKQGRLIVSIAIVGATVIASYLWHYVRPLEYGMGTIGMLRHPIDTMIFMGLIVGSPFRFTIWADIAIGLAVVTITGCMLIRAVYSSKDRRWVSTLAAIVLFLFLSSSSVVAGRLTPAVLNLGKDPLASKYFTMICALWASIGLLALCMFPGRLWTWALCLYGILFADLMFASVKRQIDEAKDWADFFIRVDAVGSSFLLDVPDEEFQSVLWPSAPERQERILFLRQHSLAIFSEPRTKWLGNRVIDLFPTLPDRCGGAIEKTVPLSRSSWRMEGWAWDFDASNPLDDILFTDGEGRIVGLARGGLRHGYAPGFTIQSEAPPPPSHAAFPQSEWLGYAQWNGDPRGTQMRLYGRFRSADKVCAITPSPPEHGSRAGN